MTTTATTHSSVEPPHAADDIAGGPVLDTDGNRRAVTWTLFAGIGLLMLGNSLQGSAVGIRSQTEGFSTLSTGLIMATYFVGFLVGSRTVSRALGLAGHIRVFAALASLTSTAALAYALAVHPVAWLGTRFVTGYCMAGLFVVAESWINDLATNENRGRLLSGYMVVTMGGMAGGQLLLTVADVGGFELFVLASILVSLSLVPVTLSASAGPAPSDPRPMPLSQLAAIAPTGLAVALTSGMAHGALIGMGPVYATLLDLSAPEVAVFMSAPLLGGLVAQFPIGAVSDRVPRRAVMLVAAAVAASAGAGLYLAGPGHPLGLLSVLVLGAATFPLYSLGIAFTNDHIEPHQITGAAASLVTTTGVGTVIGPLLATALIAGSGAASFAVLQVVVHGAVVVYVGYRIVTRAGVPIEEQSTFRPYPARASATAAQLLRRRRR